MSFNKTALALAVSAPLALTLGCSSNDDNNSASTQNFNRIASFAICEQIDTTCNVDTETVAEIVVSSDDGQLLIYTDSEQEQLGFVDIADAAKPAKAGTVALSGEPTSVAVKGNYALAAVNTSADFVNVSGTLSVVDIVAKTITRNIDLGGQPDSVAVSPDGRYALVVLENERDEDLNDGALPQLPAGKLVIVDLDGEVANWSTRDVSLTGVSDLYPSDPEPEYVDINSDNVAVVTLQENNHIVLVDLARGTITEDFSAGSINLTQIDASEEDAAIISLSESQSNVLREPDGVAWIDNQHFATADEGDLDGGSRGFTIFTSAGEVVYSSGNFMDHQAVRLGHYPDGRSGNKGNEPENVEVGTFGGTKYLFVNSERANLVFVYDVNDPTKPVFKQALPAGVGPEGGVAIAERDLLVVASEKDDRGDKFRSLLNIYQRSDAAATYPSIVSTDRSDGTPIPWSALSGLAADSSDASMFYSIEDSFYGSNRIFGIDVSESPATLRTEIKLMDSNDVFAGISTTVLADTNVDADDATRKDVFDQADLAAMINSDKSVNIDPEGIAVASNGGFWVASEGSGTVGDDDKPVNSHNLIFKTDAAGVIEQVIKLEDALNDVQLRFGLEGVTEYNGSVYVAFQRAWNGEANPRIGVYNLAQQSWSYFYYPLEAPASQNGGWVGLSDITSLGEGEFMVIERDNQGAKDAAIKRLYKFDVSGLAANSTLTKTLVRDLLLEGDLSATGGLPDDKIEGLAINAEGELYIVNDNDGVDDSNGETQLINLGSELLN